MSRTNEINLSLDDFEQSVVIRSLNDFRNTLIEDNLPTEDVDDVLIKVVRAKYDRKKRGRGRDAR